MAHCGKGTLTREHPQKPATWQYLRATCKKLSCDNCGPGKAAQYRAAIFALRREHRLQRHVVLTLDPSLIPPGRDSVEYIQQVWCRFRTFLRDKRGMRLTYVRTIELQKNGTAHFHLILKETITQDSLRKWWVECGGGHQCTIGFRDGNRGAAYITKYITKEFLRTLPAGTRRVACSRPLRLFPPQLPAGWSYTPMSFSIQWMNSYPDVPQHGPFQAEKHYFESESPPIDDSSGGYLPPPTPDKPDYSWWTERKYECLNQSAPASPTPSKPL